MSANVPTYDEILHCPNLPSLPAVAVEVLELTKNEEVDLRELAEVIQNDVALAAKILRTVNSSYYGLQKPCPTIHRALAYLGLNLVKALVLGFSLVEVTKDRRDGFDYVDYWQRSLYSAVAARRIAALRAGCDADEAFICALMQDIGMLAIQAACAKRYVSCVAATEGNHRMLVRLEREALGYDHVEVGIGLGTKWRLPETIVDAIRHHHDGDDAPDDPIVRSVVLATEGVIAFTLKDPASAIAKFRQHAAQWFGLGPEQVEILLRSLPEDAQQLARLFNVNLGSAPEMNRILDQAGEQRTKAMVDQHLELEHLQKSLTSLSREVGTDGLTEVGNRKRFDDDLERRYQQARDFKGMLGLLIVDLDHFKAVNDTYGHQAGDEILVEVARRMVRTVRDVDTVCRYGGEEFAVLLPGANTATVARVAERLRRCIVDEAFTIDAETGALEHVSMTVSVGAAVFDEETAGVLKEPGLLVKAADKALYAAKSSGRNTVRLFRVRASRAEVA